MNSPEASQKLLDELRLYEALRVQIVTLNADVAECLQRIAKLAEEMEPDDFTREVQEIVRESPIADAIANAPKPIAEILGVNREGN